MVLIATEIPLIHSEGATLRILYLNTTDGILRYRSG
jgi:hypothetical protein